MVFMSVPRLGQTGAQSIPFIEAPPIFCGPEASQNYRLPAEAMRSNVDSERTTRTFSGAELGPAGLDIVLPGGGNQ